LKYNVFKSSETKGGGVAELVVRPPMDLEVRGSNLGTGHPLFELMANASELM
jgi:hypothetical protein